METATEQVSYRNPVKGIDWREDPSKTYWQSDWTPKESVFRSKLLMLTTIFVGENEFVVMADQEGIIPSRETLTSMFRSCVAFYDNVTEEGLGRFNEKKMPMRMEIIGDESSKNIEKSKRDGYVYLLKSDQYYKIGMSKDVDARMLQISPKLPVPPELIHIIKTEDMRQLEEALHKQFNHFRVNGEWFKLDQNSVDLIMAM